MADFLTDLVNRGPTQALEKVIAFTQARQKMLAENIANIDNPSYRAKQLDAGAFQKSLREALDRQREQGGPVRLGSGKQWEERADGQVTFVPSESPAENVLYHDQTNARIERQMALMAENTMMHQAATELLRGRFDGLIKAIRGRIT